jgi:pimeloyl-ACP methyl ester carboxylesterase
MEGFVETDDEVKLRYTDDGSGPPVVFVHGWQSSSQVWATSAQALTGVCRVVTYDHRGHGRSGDAQSGWTVHRLARDLEQLLNDLDLSGTTLVGHSMGCSVIWAYMELFGPARASRLVFADQSPTMVSDPVWDQTTIDQAGAMFSDEQLRSLCRALPDPETRPHVIREVATDMVSPGRPDLTDQLVTTSLRVDGDFAAALLFNHAHQDWRRQIAHIYLPTLVMAGRASVVPLSGSQWIAETIPGARLEIFEPDQGGSHLLPIENSAKLTRLLLDFIA